MVLQIKPMPGICAAAGVSIQFFFVWRMVLVVYGPSDNYSSSILTFLMSSSSSIVELKCKGSAYIESRQPLTLAKSTNTWPKSKTLDEKGENTMENTNLFPEGISDCTCPALHCWWFRSPVEIEIDKTTHPHTHMYTVLYKNKLQTNT